MKVLFVCTGNTCRSPMAEGILKSMAAEKNLNLDIKSAGIYALDGHKSSKNAIIALNDIGIDISKHRAQRIDEDIVSNVDLILTMSKSHKEDLIGEFPHLEKKIFMLNEYAFNEERDILDPFGGNLSFYEMTRDDIINAIKSIKW